jgi:ADP-heptose:LPS heptosyltransferase
MFRTLTRLLRHNDRRYLLRGIRNRYPTLYRLGTLPFTPPYRRRELHVRRVAALGDVLLCTPALREAARCNPRLRVTFYTDIPGVVKGLPYIQEVRPTSDFPRDGLNLSYEECIPPRRHIARLFGDLIGVRVPDVTPDCAVDPELVAIWRARLRELPRPMVIVNRRAGPYTPNKDWPAGHWSDLLPQLCRLGSVVEIGQPALDSVPIAGSYLDLRGKTTLPDLIAVMAIADVHVGPISGPVHIAAAFRVPSVVIYGGYEDPVCSAYPGNRNLTFQPECSPCWLREPCPYEKKCLNAITPTMVMAAIQELWFQRSKTR